MFIGHFGAGLAAKGIDRKPSLGTSLMAAQFVDLLWPVLLLLGIESVKIEPGVTVVTPLNFVYYPFTHSLFSGIFWGIGFGVVYYLLKMDIRSSLLLGALVVSHWVLDYIVHRADLPIVPWSDFKAGLGLWNSMPLTIIIEGLIFIAGAGIYLISTKARNKTGAYSLWGLLIFLIVIYYSNLVSSPPPSDKAIGWVGLSQWIIIVWGYWIDRNRVSYKQAGEELKVSRAV
jgi:hypothetical protein